MNTLYIRLVLLAGSLYVAAKYIGIFNIESESFWTTFSIAFILLAFADSVVLPMLYAITFPIRLVTFGVDGSRKGKH